MKLEHAFQLPLKFIKIKKILICIQMLEDILGYKKDVVEDLCMYS